MNKTDRSAEIGDLFNNELDVFINEQMHEFEEEFVDLYSYYKTRENDELTQTEQWNGVEFDSIRCYKRILDFIADRVTRSGEYGLDEVKEVLAILKSFALFSDAARVLKKRTKALSKQGRI